MTFKLSQQSLDKMKGVDDNLIKVVKRAIELTKVDFKVLEGVRTLERQKDLVAQHKSQTLKSNHLIGRAVDLGAMHGPDVSWEKPLYFELATAMKQASKELNIPIRWGGDFKTFFDGPHFELV